MGDKYELCSIVYSRYGFRYFRECRYMVKLRYPNGKIHRYYYQNLPDLRKLLII